MMHASPFLFESDVFSKSLFFGMVHAPNVSMYIAFWRTIVFQRLLKGDRFNQRWMIITYVIYFLADGMDIKVV